jgi:hypothetical protein
MKLALATAFEILSFPYSILSSLPSIQLLFSYSVMPMPIPMLLLISHAVIPVFCNTLCGGSAWVL